MQKIDESELELVSGGVAQDGGACLAHVLFATGTVGVGGALLTGGPGGIPAGVLGGMSVLELDPACQPMPGADYVAPEGPSEQASFADAYAANPM
jgi:hypothetical protein